MKKPVKIIGIALLVLVVLVGAGVAAVYLNIDSLAKGAIESGGTYALGVPTKVDSVSLHVLGGEMSLRGLDVANPQGFGAGQFMAMQKGEVGVTLGSINKPVVDIPKLKLNGIDVSLERAGAGSNYGKIIDNLSKLKGSGKPSTSEKRYVIHDLTIDNVSIHADMLGAGGEIGKILNQSTKMTVPIDHIQLSNVGKTGPGAGGPGVTMEELASIVVQAVLAAAAEKGNGIIPGEILGELKGAVSSLGGLRDIPVAVVGKAGEAVSQIGGTVGKIGGEATKAINDAGKQIEQGLGGLLGGKKDEKKEPPKKP